MVNDAQRKSPLVGSLLMGLAACLAVLWLARQVTPARAQRETPEPVAILSPMPGEAVQGVVPVMVNATPDGFQSAELVFGYVNDPTETWFLIAVSSESMIEGKFVDWDTTTLTDGNYTLRLVVTLEDGSQIAALCAGVRVRNYSPVESDTSVPSPTAGPGQTPLPTVTPTPTGTPYPPTPTPFAANPAQVTTRDLQTSLRRGVLVAFVLFAMLGVYRFLHRPSRR
jgi:hypothetical protein